MGKIAPFFISLFLFSSAFGSDFSSFLSDPENRVSSDFKIPQDFHGQASFWFKIYTTYRSDQFVLHDKSNPEIILKVVDINDHPGKSASQVQNAVLIEYKNALDSLANGDKTCGLCPSLVSLYQKERPKNNAVHKSFYSLKKSQLRFQTGQRNYIEKGLFYYSSYEQKIAEIRNLFEVPKELIAIAFLESSFNTEARSRLNATGIWQFMKNTGQDFLLIESKKDHRLNPLISTLAAFQFLKQLHKTFGRWDLAIWSYNSGAQHIRNALQTFERPTMSLSDFFKFYKHRSIGFASESFYPSFLALTHAIAYRDKIYQFSAKKYLNIDSSSLHFYISLCPVKPQWFYQQLKGSLDTAKLNRHLLPRYNQTQFPRGTILVSDANLTARKYYKVPPELYTQRYPKNWRYHIKRLKCR